MRIPKTQTIKEFTYTVEPLGAKLGGIVGLRLGKVLSGGLDLDKLSSDDFSFICDTFAKVTTVSGGSYGTNAPVLANVFDDHFAAKYLDMVLWLKFCLETNFQSFLTELAVLLKEEAGAATKGLFGFQAPSTGKSGE